jgi:hypothetical protein
MLFASLILGILSVTDFFLTCPKLKHYSPSLIYCGRLVQMLNCLLILFSVAAQAL